MSRGFAVSWTRSPCTVHEVPAPMVLRMHGSCPCCGCLAWGSPKSSLASSCSQGLVRDIIYKGTEAQIQQCAGPDGTVPLVCHYPQLCWLHPFCHCGWDRSPHWGMGHHSLSPAVPSQVCGVVFFSSSAAEQLLATHVIPPLDACTYMGLDSGAPPIQVTPPRVLVLGAPLCPCAIRFGCRRAAPSSGVGLAVAAPGGLAAPRLSLLSSALPFL